jgi:acyl-coenzyme A thioesterase PaaI-like protein
MSGPASTLTVPRRFRGPATSGNGGWTSGALAAALLDADDRRAVRVRLSAPPPLETAMALERSEDSVTASAQGRLVATATLLDDAPGGLAPVPPVSVEAAERASERYPGLTGHPFPECFVCGTARSDGLGLRPGPVHDGGDDRVAAVWRPDETLTGDDGRVTAPVVWAALDCPGGWSVDIVGRPMVLGTMTARVLERPSAGEPLVVAGRALDVSERKAVTATTLYRPDGAVVALATHVWVAVDPATFGAQ